MKLSRVLLLVLSLLVGIVIGGYLFRDVQPRSFLAVDRCSHCWSQKDVAGLVGSVLVTKAGYVPKIVKETEKTILIEHPKPTANIHLVAIPKRDIRDAGNISREDQEYLVDAYAVMQEVVHSNSLNRYRIVTNGPGYQDVTYLHFHLQARD